MTYTVGIVAHPKRFEQAHQLAAQVDANVIVMDTDSQGERWCHQQALRELMKREADWYVLLEDDALPCANFRDHLENALDDAGNALVSLYLGTGKWADASPETQRRLIPALITQADNDNADWITTNRLWHAVGIAIPSRHADDALNAMRMSRQPSDKALSQWARGNHLPVRYTWPSLVDHADGDRITGRSRPAQRTAWRTRPMGA